jgi:hypothetical protein
MKRFLWAFLANCWALALIGTFHPVLAQVAPPAKIIYGSFNGVYHLSRDASDLSLLTVEENISAHFPSNGNFSGISRQIPKNFQGRSVEVKVLSVQDAASNPVPYKTTSNKDNVVVTTGDPDIKLIGSQIFKINYQAKGVVNLAANQDEFLLNINGRGWDQPFGRVSGTLHIPTSFAADLRNSATCYLSTDNLKSNNCQINSQKTNSEFLLSAKAAPVAAHQALIIKVDFKPATFTDKRSSLNIKWLISGLIALIVVTISGYKLLLRKK